MLPLPKSAGWVEIIAGCMFSGKTEELQRRIRRARIAKQKVVIFKPKIDNRYSEEKVSAHTGYTLDAIPVESAAEIWDRSADADVVAVDEVQFFDTSLIEITQRLADDGKRVILAGLDLDYKGVPFGPIPHLLAVAEYPSKLFAVCVCCGSRATRSQRIVDSQEQILIGAASAYEARCRRCWSPEPVFTRQDAVGQMEG